MAFKSTPGTFRSLRHIAEEKNRSAGFEGAIDYCAQCGHPLTGGVPHGHYEDKAEQAKPSYPAGVHEVFTIKGK